MYASIGPSVARWWAMAPDASSSPLLDNAAHEVSLLPVPKLPSLLVVDDELPQLEALCGLLGDIGYEVTGRSDPAEAIELLNKQSFDVLLSDLKMPGIDGIALMKRAAEADPDLVTVLMTGHGSVDTAVAAMKVGALDYVLKPFRLSAITPVISRALEVRRLRVQNRELLQEVMHNADKLQTANRELDAFAARIAHDLRAPIHIMQGFARFVLEAADKPFGDRERGYLQRIVDAGDRADGLIRNLLAFARLGDAPMHKRDVALDCIVDRAREMVCSEPVNAGRRIEWVIRPMPIVLGDPDLLLQVFVNLLSNAVKYTRPCGHARIDVDVGRSGKQCEIWVRDNGAGFNPDYADRLFEPFQRLHRADEFEGTGMGLANVKRIVERHGGVVRAESRLGDGAAFAISLPLVSVRH